LVKFFGSILLTYTLGTTTIQDTKASHVYRMMIHFFSIVTYDPLSIVTYDHHNSVLIQFILSHTTT